MATKTLKAKTTVKSAAKTAAKTAAKPAKEKKAKTTLKPLKAQPTVDDNLKKLAASRLPVAFVKEHNGAWNHQDWLNFLIVIKEKGFDPIDPDRVGLILEDLKTKLLSK